MSTKKQVIYIGLLFLGLMLLSAGVGALAAGAFVWGAVFLVAGLFVTGITGAILYVFWKRNQTKQKNEPLTEDKKEE